MWFITLLHVPFIFGWYYWKQILPLQATHWSSFNITSFESICTLWLFWDFKNSIVYKAIFLLCCFSVYKLGSLRIFINLYLLIRIIRFKEFVACLWLKESLSRIWCSFYCSPEIISALELLTQILTRGGLQPTLWPFVANKDTICIFLNYVIVCIDFVALFGQNVIYLCEVF